MFRSGPTPEKAIADVLSRAFLEIRGMAGLRRRQALRAIEYLWTTVGDRQLRWLHAGFDKTGYDYSELDEHRASVHEELRRAGHPD